MRQPLIFRTACAFSARLTRSRPSRREGLTLVELLVSMAITLLMMAAIVTVFANVSRSVTRRRATIEMSGQLRGVREALARDLENATCPTVPWRRPEANEGYFEIIEGPQNDYYPSVWLYSQDTTTGSAEGVTGSLTIAEIESSSGSPAAGRITEAIGNTPGIDLSVSTLPGSTLRDARLDVAENTERFGKAIGSYADLPDSVPTDGRGLGDADDTLMFTVRNENEPFVGRIPRRDTTGATPANSSFNVWGNRFEEITSPLAEVAWYAIENPPERDEARTFAFGEPGYRTIYRRVLLIAPTLDYGIFVGGVPAGPGVVRVFDASVGRNSVAQALAGLIAFQERFDLSVRLEWSPKLARWQLRLNTLGDLTKRENRFEHHGLVPEPVNIWYRHGKPADDPDRFFPFAAVSGGVYGSGARKNLVFVTDPELASPSNAAEFDALTADLGGGQTTVVAYESDGLRTAILAGNRAYAARPLVLIDDSSDAPATARAVVNEDGNVVHVTFGLAPLSGARRGEDIMLTNALAFDVRVYDPGAPLYGYYPNGDITVPADQIIGPGEPAWARAYSEDAADNGVGYNQRNNQSPTPSNTYPFLYERQGAYVDLGYGSSFIDSSTGSSQIPNRYFRTTLAPWSVVQGQDLVTPSFSSDGLVRTPSLIGLLTRRFAMFDTWSWHYENNGINEDGDRPDGLAMTGAAEAQQVDEGVNGLDDFSFYDQDLDGRNDEGPFQLHGPDDTLERETMPPYSAALRGVEVSLRAYERDSRQVRQTSVRESFVPE